MDRFRGHLFSNLPEVGVSLAVLSDLFFSGVEFGAIA